MNRPAPYSVRIGYIAALHRDGDIASSSESDYVQAKTARLRLAYRQSYIEHLIGRVSLVGLGLVRVRVRHSGLWLWIVWYMDVQTQGRSSGGRGRTLLARYACT